MFKQCTNTHPVHGRCTYGAGHTIKFHGVSETYHNEIRTTENGARYRFSKVRSHHWDYNGNDVNPPA